VLPELERRGIAALGMKSLGGDGQPILHGRRHCGEALRYAMSLPVATTISGIDSVDVLRQNLAIARGFTPMTPGSDAGAPPPLRSLRRGRAPRTVQIDQAVRWGGGPPAARLSAGGPTPALIMAIQAGP